MGVVHRHGGMDVVRRGHTVCHRRRKHLSVRTILDLQIIPMMGQSVVKEDRLSVTILFLKVMIWIIKIVVAKSMIQYGNLFEKYLDYFDSRAPSKKNVH